MSVMFVISLSTPVHVTFCSSLIILVCDVSLLAVIAVCLLTIMSKSSSSITTVTILKSILRALMIRFTLLVIISTTGSVKVISVARITCSGPQGKVWVRVASWGSLLHPLL